MLTEEYLNLRLVRLKPGEETILLREGLSFLFPKGGEGRLACGNGQLPMGAGDVLVIHVGAGHRVTALGQADLVFWSFALCLEHLFPLFSVREFPLLHNTSDNLKTGRRYPEASELAQECHRLLAETPPQSNLDHRCQLLRIVAAILNVEFKQAAPQRAGFVRIEDHILQVFEKLSPTEIVELSVGELAQKFSCSRRHLNRLFHQHFGFSVAALRMEMRLLKAVSLLRDPDSKIINVAEQCGFNHLGLFNSCFRRRFDMSPGQWRKSTAAAAAEAAKTSDAPNSETNPACQMRTSGLCPWSGGANKPYLLSPFRP